VTPRWQAAHADQAVSGGWAIAHCRQGFLFDSNGVLFPRDWLKRQDLDVLSEQYLGRFEEQPVTLLELHSPAEIQGCAWQNLRQFLMQPDRDLFRMLGYAEQIGGWARQHRFCGSCGGRMEHLPNSRCMRCAVCELDHYTRIAPSMITLVTRGDEILLARSARFTTPMFSTLAGFVEAGESVEECVAREVREEVGVEVGKVTYIASQPWPFPNSLMLGYHAEYVSGEIVPEEGEIAEARWFHVSELPMIPPPASISRYLIDLYVARRLGLPEPVLPG
jgi:NAD+ diphosphatase